MTLLLELLILTRMLIATAGRTTQMTLHARLPGATRTLGRHQIQGGKDPVPTQSPPRVFVRMRCVRDVIPELGHGSRRRVPGFRRNFWESPFTMSWKNVKNPATHSGLTCLTDNERRDFSIHPGPDVRAAWAIAWDSRNEGWNAPRGGCTSAARMVATSRFRDHHRSADARVRHQRRRGR